MPKLKTSSSAKKRIVKVTAKGKLLRRRLVAQHLARKKSKRTKQKSGRSRGFFKGDLKKIRRLVPYLK